MEKIAFIDIETLFSNIRITENRFPSELGEYYAKRIDIYEIVAKWFSVAQHKGYKICIFGELSDKITRWIMNIKGLNTKYETMCLVTLNTKFPVEAKSRIKEKILKISKNKNLEITIITSNLNRVEDFKESLKEHKLNFIYCKKIDEIEQYSKNKKIISENFDKEIVLDKTIYIWSLGSTYCKKHSYLKINGVSSSIFQIAIDNFEKKYEELKDKNGTLNDEITKKDIMIHDMVYEFVFENKHNEKFFKLISLVLKEQLNHCDKIFLTIPPYIGNLQHMKKILEIFDYFRKNPINGIRIDDNIIGSKMGYILNTNNIKKGETILMFKIYNNYDQDREFGSNLSNFNFLNKEYTLNLFVIASRKINEQKMEAERILLE